MAEEKKSFKLYFDQYAPTRTLPDEYKARLWDAVFQFNMGEDVHFDDPLLEALFAFFRQQFQRNDDAYAETCKKNSENARKRWQRDECDAMPTDATACDRMPADAKPCDAMPTDAKNADNDNDNDVFKNKNTVSNETVADKPLSASPAQVEKDACPQQAIIALYHEMLPELPRVRQWRSAEQTALRTRWREKRREKDSHGRPLFRDDPTGLDYFRRMFARIRNSDFLMGRCPPSPGREKPFMLTLKWLVKASNFDKVCDPNMY